MIESIGQRLKKLRLEKGLSIEDVHKKTKIHLNILRAIEEDGLIGFNPTYMKGFLKIYCKFLGVDPNEYAKTYDSPRLLIKETQEKRGLSPAASAKTEKKPEPAPEKPVSFIKPQAEKSASMAPMDIPWKPIIITILFVVSVVVLFNIGKFFASGISPKSKKITAAAKKKAVPAPKIQKAQAPKPPEKIQPVIKYPVTGPDIRLGMRVKEDCWVDLKADGRVFLHGILRKGTFESWQAKNRIEFSLGNAGVVDLELNGKPLPPLGRKSQQIKRVIITKEEGLVVLR